ncbi:MAG: helix-turn-helix domain-containing protein [Actinomadura sp.]
MLFYRAALDLSHSACTFVADLIRRYRRQVGSRWRRLPPGRQALLVLVHLHRSETFAGLAAAFGVGAATAHRYATEVVELLAELAPDLRQVLRIAQRKAYVILDGALVPTDTTQGLAGGGPICKAPTPAGERRRPLLADDETSADRSAHCQFADRRPTHGSGSRCGLRLPGRTGR